MKSPSTVYLITRTHGLQQHLLKSGNFIKILRLKSLSEIYDFLLKSEYSKELSLIPAKELDAYQLERIFYQKLSQRLFFLVQISSGKIREALEAYCSRIEIENLIRVTRSVHAKEKIDEDLLIPIPRKYQKINFPALLQSRTVKEMVLLLRETEYEKLGKTLDLYEKYKNPLIIEAEADRIYYELLWQKIRKITDKNDAKNLVGTEVDLKNLLNVLSLKYIRADPEFLAETIINIYHRLPKSLLQKSLDATYQAVPDLVAWPKYVELTRKAVELMSKGITSNTESIFSQYLYSYAEATMLRKPNSLVYMFAYMYLCAREARNLTTLTTGKQLRLKEEKIQSLLFL